MINKIRLMLLSVSTLFAVAVPALASTTTSAIVTQKEINGATCSGTTGELAGNHTIDNCDVNQSDFDKYASTIINILSVIIGFVAVVMILIGGFRYITSAGNSENVAKAKNTILYGIIGLVIVALAQIIVQFVLNRTATAGT